jgi:hypothetical protein
MEPCLTASAVKHSTVLSSVLQHRIIPSNSAMQRPTATKPHIIVVRYCPHHMLREHRLVKASNSRYRDLQPNYKFDHHAPQSI